MESDVDKPRNLCYDMHGLPTVPRDSHTVAVAFPILHWESTFLIEKPFSIDCIGGGGCMYMTWELFLLFCGVVIQLIALVVSFFKDNDRHNHTKKK